MSALLADKCCRNCIISIRVVRGRMCDRLASETTVRPAICAPTGAAGFTGRPFKLPYLILLEH
jgi:hypothetical protein